jgi:hypothetical protein
MGGGQWFLIILILCLIFGMRNVFSTIAAMLGYLLLALLVLAALSH